MKIGPLKLAKRQSFLINPEGIIVKHYAKVDPTTHTEEVLTDLRAAIAAASSSEPPSTSIPES